MFSHFQASSASNEQASTWAELQYMYSIGYHVLQHCSVEWWKLGLFVQAYVYAENTLVAYFEQAQYDVKSCPKHLLLIFHMTGNDAREFF